MASKQRQEDSNNKDLGNGRINLTPPCISLAKGGGGASRCRREVLAGSAW
jgi:hypothetical protein